MNDDASSILNREFGYQENNDRIPDPKVIDPVQHASKEIMSKYRFVTVQESRKILVYSGGVYSGGGEIIIEKESERILGFMLTNKDVNEIKGHIIRKTYRSLTDFDTDLNIINMSNGLYNVSENKLIPHTPDYLSMKQIKIDYDANARPKLFGKFLSEVLYPEEIRTLVELFAYTFHRDNPYEIITTLLGYGSNGKSVLIGLLTRLHGANNVSNVSLRSILTNRFALSDLEGKAVNVDTEMSNTTIEDAAILKKLTGKQPVRIERKNEKAYDAILYAKPFFNANKIPETKDDSDAFYRRNVIISLPNQFEEVASETSLKIADPYILDKLTDQNELSGIFNILMLALRTVLKSKRVHINDKTIQQRREKYCTALDPVKSFLNDAVAEDSTESDSITKQELYSAYKRFCQSHKLAILKIERFGSNIKKLYSDGRQSSGKRLTTWKGIRLNEKYRLDALQQTIL